MAGRDIVVIGASAGGVDAVMQLVSELPAELPALICVVVHVPGEAESALPSILSRAGSYRHTTPPTGSRSRPGASSSRPPITTSSSIAIGSCWDEDPV